MESPWHQQPAQRHYPRDGYDFRAPVMSSQNGSNMERTHHEQNTIDLTGDRNDHSPAHMRRPLPYVSDGGFAEVPGPSSRNQRPPRFDRNIINLEHSDEEDHTTRQSQHYTRSSHSLGQSTAQDDDSLFIPDTSNDYPHFTAGTHSRPRPTTSGLRPGYMRQHPPAAGNDELQVLGYRSISRQPSGRSTPALPRPSETANNAGSATIDLTADDDDDDVIHTSTRTLPGINSDRPAMAGSGVGTRERPVFGIAHLAQAMRARGASPGIFDRFPGLGAADMDDPAARARAHQRLTRDNADQLRRQREFLERRNARMRDDERRGEQEQRLERRQIVRGGRTIRVPPQILDVRMDFGAVAFDLGLNGPARPATPKYEPPPPAEKGFTRSPEEDEEVVCPNCGDELAVSEDETKAQVWVVKGCGHVSGPCVDPLSVSNGQAYSIPRLTAANVPLAPAHKLLAKRARAEPWTPTLRSRSRNASWWVARRPPPKTR